MKTSESDERPIVFIIEDNQSLREALKDLFSVVDLRVETFAQPTEFLTRKLPDVPACIVLDVRLPGISGLELQAELTAAGIKIPIIFMTGYGDIPMTVKAMKGGAVEFLPKPFRDQDMLDAVQLALKRDRARREAGQAAAQFRRKFDSLSSREQEVMVLVAAGLMNKQIAFELGVAEVTVKLHRGSLMRKMGARSVAELARMAEVLGIPGPKP